MLTPRCQVLLANLVEALSPTSEGTQRAAMRRLELDRDWLRNLQAQRATYGVRLAEAAPKSLAGFVAHSLPPEAE